MPSRRVLKANQAIREVVSTAILHDLNDPRVQDVTVTGVEVTPDMRQAKVFVSVMGNETKQQLSLRGLQSSAGYLQSKVANRIETRYTPRLEFVLDQGVKKLLEMAEILHRVLPREAEAPKPESAQADFDENDVEESDFDDRGLAAEHPSDDSEPDSADKEHGPN
jgi:ribosome-binding factor A